MKEYASILGLRAFVKHFGKVKSAQVIYEGPFNQTFIEDVRSRKLPVWEGGAVKSRDYLAKLKEVFHDDWEKYGE